MDERLVFYAGNLPHFASHCAPIWLAMPEDRRGPFFARGRAREEARRLGIPFQSGTPKNAPLVITASYEDYRAVNPARVILVNHGIGQRYIGDERAADNPCYSGGRNRERVVLNISPSERDAKVCRDAGQEAVAVGVPKLDPWHPSTFTGNEQKVVAISHHADVHVCPETRWTHPHYKQAIINLAARAHDRGITLLGHAHPRVHRALSTFWASIGVEYTPHFSDVLNRADLYVIDNSCVAPDTPVLCADLEWRPAGELKPGDEVVACDEEAFRPQRHPKGEVVQREDRRFRTAVVEANRIELRPCYEVSTTEGTLVVSDKHPWLARERITHEYLASDQRGREYLHKSYRTRWSWKEARYLDIGDEVAFLVQPWLRDETREAGWLAGLFDGEGTFYAGKAARISVAQNPGLVLDEVIRLLRERKIAFSSQAAGGKCRKLTLGGTLADRLNFLGSIRPVRLFAKAITSRFWEGTQVSAQVKKAEVLSIRYLGLQEVAVMSTSEKTFIAGGFLAHNSTLYEFASTGRPVVVLDAPHYRTHVHHGARFWEYADVGIRIQEPTQLESAILDALCDFPLVRKRRERIVSQVYDGVALDGRATERAVNAILDYMDRDAT